MTIPVLTVGCIGLFFGIVLSIASIKLRVHVDPNIEKILNSLPNANCGACGYPGCSAFAKAVAEGRADPTGCIPGGSRTANDIADILGVDTGESEAMMAVVHCKGGDNEAKNHAAYEGISDCRAATLISNGEKECQYGCLGLGNCVEACPFDAISINDNGVAVVNDKKCTGCGKCIEACPHGIISLIPKVHNVFLACSNHERGAKVKKYCSVGCTGCTLCVKATPSGAISMNNSLPELDYTKNDNFLPAAYKCPSNCFTDLIKKRPKVNIDTKCDGCSKCIEICPVKGAISGEKDKRHIINKEKCIGCGLCLDICPQHAISLMGGLGYDKKGKRQR